MRGTTLLSCAAAAALLGTSITARADGDDVDRDPWRDLHFEADVNLLLGGMSFGKLDGFAGGLGLMAGARRDRVALYGEYDLLSVGQSTGEPTDVRGYLQRGGLTARYSVARFGGGDVGVRGDIWFEGGLGAEVTQWYGGGRLHRGDLDLGFGVQPTFRIGHGSHAHYIGFHYAIKAFIAHSPPSKDDTLPTCVGPCDEPTPPVPYDFGVFFDLGIVFSR